MKNLSAKMIVGVVLGFAGFVGTASAGDDVLIVKQGDAEVTLADVEGFLQQQVPPEQQQGYLSSADRVNKMLIGILRDKQLANQALAMKLDQDPLVRNQMAYTRNLVLSINRVRAFEAGLNVPSMEAAAKEEYLAHKAEYVIPEMVDVQHVLITATGRSDAEAKTLAEKVRSEAAANPAGFDELVAKYSDDPAKAHGKGEIPAATSGRYVAEFAAGAKKLKTVGEISPVVKTGYGYHVLKLTRRVPPKQQDFTAVKDQLMAKLKQDYIVQQRTAFLNKLDDAPASANAEGVEAMRKRYNLDAVADIGEAIKALKPEAKK